jgi:hypothetical protein
MEFSLRNIIILVVCIVVANLLLVLLRSLVDLPFADGLESAVATGIGALAWFFIVPRLRGSRNAG